jgi:hypothetical protein
MNGKRYGHAEDDYQRRKHIHPHTAFLERGEETGSDLQTEREHKEYQTEVTDKTPYGRVDNESEMGQKDSDKKNPGHSQGDSENLDLPQEYAQRDHYRDDQYGVSHTVR